MRKIITLILLLSTVTILVAQENTIKSPDEKLSVNVFIKEGAPTFNVKYNNVPILEDSP